MMSLCSSRPVANASFDHFLATLGWNWKSYLGKSAQDEFGCKREKRAGTEKSWLWIRHWASPTKSCGKTKGGLTRRRWHNTTSPVRTTQKVEWENLDLRRRKIKSWDCTGQKRKVQADMGKKTNISFENLSKLRLSDRQPTQDEFDVFQRVPEVMGTTNLVGSVVCPTTFAVCCHTPVNAQVAMN